MGGGDRTLKSVEMAKSYLDNAGIILNEAEESYKKGLFHRVIRLSQESVELSLKAALRIIGIEYPKSHDVSDILIEYKERFPEWFKKELNKLAEGSTWLSEKRGLAMYGDEIKGIPPNKLFDRDDALKALSYSKKYVYIS